MNATKTEPRELTADEVRNHFLASARDVCHYWATLSRAATTRERIEGAVFSLLAVIDGEGTSLPGFTLSPKPHPNDKDYHLERGEPWYPERDCDIAGSLHEHFFDRGK